MRVCNISLICRFLLYEQLQKLVFAHLKPSFNHFWSTTGSGVDRIHKESADFPGFSEMCPTLKSRISELNEYFLMGPVPLQRSMSKLYNAPNTIKNGHLAQKLRSMKGRGFSGKCKKSLSIPTYRRC